MKHIRFVINKHRCFTQCFLSVRNIINVYPQEWYQNKTELSAKYQNISTKEAYSYQKLYPWKTLEQFSDYVISTIVYNKDNLVILSKPFGVKAYNTEKDESKKDSFISRLNIKEYPFAIQDVLPVLKDHLNVPHLHIIKSAERFSSGILIMGTDEKADTDLRRSYDIARQNKVPFLTHQFLTAGNPVVLHKREKIGIKQIEVGDQNIKQPVIENKISNRACKNNTMKAVTVEYKVLSNNQNVHSSLVEIACTSTKWYFLRVYAASRIASILGDFIFGSRTNTVLGLPVQLKPHAPRHQQLPESLQQKLNLRKGTADSMGIPTMLHFKSIFLPSYHGQDITITVEPPPHFQWTCTQLNLLP